jgi:hypothetical protein
MRSLSGFTRLVGGRYRKRLGLKQSVFILQAPCRNLAGLPMQHRNNQVVIISPGLTTVTIRRIGRPVWMGMIESDDGELLLPRAPLRCQQRGPVNLVRSPPVALGNILCQYNFSNSNAVFIRMSQQ